MPIIGAHVSVAGGLYRCFENASAIGATAIQIFGASPRQWTAKIPTPEAVQQFKDAEKSFGLGPVFLHAAYLVNLGTPNAYLYNKSIENLTEHLRIAEAIGAVGLIFHIGSAKDNDRMKSQKQVADAMNDVLKRVPGHSLLIMENAAGGGDKLGATMEEIGTIFRLAKNKRVKVCIDTQHAFAAGAIQAYTKKDVDAFAKEIDVHFGLEHVVALHLNDSKSECDSHYDRHENIGEGHIGKAGFKVLAEHNAFARLPWLLEVPGFVDTGPDKKNVDIIKKIISSV